MSHKIASGLIEDIKLMMHSKPTNIYHSNNF